ncbi:acyl-ACP thioesterase [Paenibacillus spiritus]|uniref:Acyl-ACP thioesterase n=1 Tax=Paenibacillus spiritus TaxID=2496557 RepID=A0A5J5GBA4_9BACL|nr:acyl-ACP thioesterase domain-containing protein [Paenibacillus spiritus]KAA9005102.1 acyl-ACP thioesterase [Paenibacillus spiritus]
MSQSGKIYEGKYTVHSSDTDFRSKGKLSFLLDIMQRAADSAVQDYQVSLAEMLKLNMGWMLMTLDLEIRRMPTVEDELVVRTWSKGTKGALWQRDFRILATKAGAEEGTEAGKAEEIAVARTIWALVDTGKRKMLRPSAFPVPVEHYTEDSVGAFPAQVKAPEGTEWQEVYPYIVRYSGLDQYGHLNNARYGDLCCDVLELEEWRGIDLKHFRITYVQEATVGAEIGLQRAKLKEGCLAVRGWNGEAVCFEAELEWEAEESEGQHEGARKETL